MEQFKKAFEDKGIKYTQALQLKDIESFWIISAYNFFDQSVTATAHSLGIGRSTLYRKIKELNGSDQKPNIR